VPATEAVAVSTAWLPTCHVAQLLVMETVYGAASMTVAEATAVQPLASVVVTEYVPATDTESVLLVEPSDQRYETAAGVAEAVNVVEPPAQIPSTPEMLADEAFTVTAVAAEVGNIRYHRYRSQSMNRKQ